MRHVVASREAIFSHGHVGVEGQRQDPGRRLDLWGHPGPAVSANQGAHWKLESNYWCVSLKFCQNKHDNGWFDLMTNCVGHTRRDTDLPHPGVKMPPSHVNPIIPTRFLYVLRCVILLFLLSLSQPSPPTSAHISALSQLCPLTSSPPCPPSLISISGLDTVSQYVLQYGCECKSEDLSDSSTVFFSNTTTCIRQYKQMSVT